jgi:hypothetical protein
MAAGQLGKPGTKHGPCKGKCKHYPCAAKKMIACSVCRFCSERIDYERRFYQDPDRQGCYVHAVCLEEAADKHAKGQVIDTLDKLIGF